MVDTLYVGNLPYHYEESDIRTLFKGCGQIVKVELRKGFAFVQMLDQKGAMRVLNYDGHKVMGRMIKVKAKEEQTRRSRSPARQERRENRKSAERDKEYRR